MASCAADPLHQTRQLHLPASFAVAISASVAIATTTVALAVATSASVAVATTTVAAAAIRQCLLCKARNRWQQRGLCGTVSKLCKLLRLHLRLPRQQHAFRVCEHLAGQCGLHGQRRGERRSAGVRLQQPVQCAADLVRGPRPVCLATTRRPAACAAARPATCASAAALAAAACVAAATATTATAFSTTASFAATLATTSRTAP